MSYVFAALRTVLILFGICAALLVVLLLASAVVVAFGHSWLAGSLTLAIVSGMCVLFGQQLRRIAKSSRTRLVGAAIYFGFGVIAAGALLSTLLVPLEIYLWTSAYLPALKHFGVEPPFGQWGQLLALFVFLDISLTFTFVAPARIVWWLIK
jgi:uncharacterized membrane protein